MILAGNIFDYYCQQMAQDVWSSLASTSLLSPGLDGSEMVTNCLRNLINRSDTKLI